MDRLAHDRPGCGRFAAAVLGGCMLWAGAFAAHAQDDATDLRETHQDWLVQCAPAGNGTGRACQMSQELRRTEDDQRVLNVTIQRNSDGQPVTTITTPLGVVLEQGVALSVGGDELQRYGYHTCVAAGCIALGRLANETMEVFRASGEATVSMGGLDGNQLDLGISLMGFTAAWERLAELSG